MTTEQMMNEAATRDTYKFLNALLDDYAACKTELARAGIFKAYKTMLERIGEEHLKWIKKAMQTDAELMQVKAQLPKSAEEISKILHAHGLQDLKECNSGSSGFQALDMTRKQYGELYRYLYDEMTSADKKKFGAPNGSEDKKLVQDDRPNISESSSEIHADGVSPNESSVEIANQIITNNPTTIKSRKAKAKKTSAKKNKCKEV